MITMHAVPDGQTDRLTDGQTDKHHVRHCALKIERNLTTQPTFYKFSNYNI